MKSIPATFSLLLLCLLLCGCGPVASLFGLYTPEDKFVDQKLVGEWKQVSPPGEDSPDEKLGRWVFQLGKDSQTYSVTLMSLDKPGSWRADARLVRLGDFEFVDFTASSDALNSETSAVPFPSVPVHMIGRIWIESGRVKIHFLADDWVKAQVKAGSLALPHIVKEGDPILLAPTEELRKFALEHAEDKEAFTENYELVRVD